MRRLSNSSVLIAPALAFAALTGCSKQAPPEMVFPPPAVSVSAALERDVTNYQNVTGRTRAFKMVQVRARVTGYLEKVNFKDGDMVNEKDVLGEIDQRLYRASFDQAEANVAQIEARVNRLQGEFERTRVLFTKGTISVEEFEKYKADLKEGQSTLLSTRAALATARQNLDYTRMLAPLSGRVSQRNIDPGNLIRADDTILTTIVTQDPMYVYFDVDDRAFLQVEKMMREGKFGVSADKSRSSLGGKSNETAGNSGASIPVYVGLINEKGYPHAGVMNFVDNQVDAGTGTMRMRAIFNNKSGLLTPGLFVRVRLPMDEPHRAVLVTDRAVDTDHGQKVVYVIGKEDLAEKREVELGGVHDGLREIVKGLRAGEQVIVDGIQRVRPGAKVNPKTVEMPGTSPNDQEASATKTAKK